ncbi:MAG: hypothetical protein R3272_00870 [Candidatus Promineifilaceae bacterium]|nr:hypothetical protein [Candidatus Promineifilaceae bacterium]
MVASQSYEEEAFGILTDDDVYLDCILVKPKNMTDDMLRALRVWVPRYPLTKSSIITCARQEVQSYGADGRIAHLVFDLRGTGNSEGKKGERNFEMDLQGVRLWAVERFGKINFGFLGTPQGAEQVDVRPIRPNVVMELYHYRPSSTAKKPPLIYLATYGNFSPQDNTLCCALADAGYDVYGMDPLRYLLHASVGGRLEVRELWQDMRALCRQLPGRPLVVGQPVSAGMALLWSSGVEAIDGVVAIGRAQIAFKPLHIFKNDNPHVFFLSRYVHKIAPRPMALVMLTDHPLGGERDEMAALYQSAVGVREIKQAAKITPEFLLQRLNWLQKNR